MLKIAATLENLPAMLSAIRQFAADHQVISEKSDEIEVSAEEILVNIINYAYPDTSGDIEIDCQITPEKKLIMTITDWGVPFDPRTLPDPDIDLPLEEREKGGLGIWIVRNLTEELDYHRENEKNILTLIFGLS